MVAFDMGSKKMKKIKRRKPRELSVSGFLYAWITSLDDSPIWIDYRESISLKEAIRLRDWLDKAIEYLSDKEKHE